MDGEWEIKGHTGVVKWGCKGDTEIVRGGHTGMVSGIYRGTLEW